MRKIRNNAGDFPISGNVHNFLILKKRGKSEKKTFLRKGRSAVFITPLPPRGSVRYATRDEE